MPFLFDRPLIARALPFFLFMALLALRAGLPADGSAGVDPRWIYGLTVLLVGASLVWFWRAYVELHQMPALKDVALAVVVGLLVYVLWVNLDADWMQTDKLLPMLGLAAGASGAAAVFVPLDAQGQIMWPLVAVRWIGAALLVPIMEELFWRSFLMRWVDDPGFQRVDPRSVSMRAVLVSTFAFMLVHTLWLAAIVAGLAYAWLYKKTGSLWVPVISHAVTNGVLGVHVVQTGQWHYW